MDQFGYTESDIDTWAELKTVANTILADAGVQAANPDLDGYVAQLDAYEGGVVNFFEWIGSNGATSIFDGAGNIDVTNADIAAAMDFVPTSSVDLPSQYVPDRWR